MPSMPTADTNIGSADPLAGSPAVEGAIPPAPPEPKEASKGGLFGKLMGKAASPPPPPETSAPPDMGPPPGTVPPADSAGMHGDASFDAGFPETGFPDQGEGVDPALADPNLVAAAFGETALSDKPPRKKPPVVAISWGLLALIVVSVLGLFFLAPQTTVSVLPGASSLYSMFGIPVGAQGLEFEGVRYGWTNSEGKPVLEVQGNVRNTSSSAMSVPTVIIVLRDESGAEISEWQTEVGAAELAAGEDAPFLRQIPSPPSNVRSLKVRFAKAG